MCSTSQELSVSLCFVGIFYESILPTVFRLTSLTLTQSHDCTSEATLKNMDNYITCIQYKTDNISIAKQSTAKPCVDILGFSVHVHKVKFTMWCRSALRERCGIPTVKTAQQFIGYTLTSCLNWHTWSTTFITQTANFTFLWTLCISAISHDFVYGIISKRAELNHCHCSN